MSYVLVAGGALVLACGQIEPGGVMVGAGLCVWIWKRIAD